VWGAIPPLPQNDFMVWCSVESAGENLPLPYHTHETPEGKRLLGTLRRRWERNIIMGLKEIRREDVNLIT